MKEEIQAALDAAKNYSVRNEGERASSELIGQLLADAARHADTLDELANEWDRQDRVRRAQDELNAAQAGVALPQLDQNPQNQAAVAPQPQAQPAVTPGETV